MSIFESIVERLNAIEQRLERGAVMGKVTHVDAAKGLYRQTIGVDDKGEPVLSPWIPYSQHAGALKAHIPPSVGQQMMAISNGDLENGVGVPFTWSDSNTQPNDKGNENTITFRGVQIDFTDGLKITIGGTVYDFTGAGFTQTGGFQKHDGKNVGKDHVHGEVTPGGSDTGVPSN